MYELLTEHMESLLRDKVYDAITDAFMIFQQECAVPSEDIPFDAEFNIDKAVDNLCEKVEEAMRVQMGG